MKKMKKILIVVFICFITISGIAFAGEVRTLPKYLVLSDPTTNQSEFITLTHYYDADNPYAIVTVHVLDSTGVRDSIPILIKDVEDNPYSITAECTDIGIPWPLCSGVGTCENDCDETSTAYTDAIAGYGATMKSRFDVLVWNKLKELYPTQETP